MTSDSSKTVERLVDNLLDERGRIVRLEEQVKNFATKEDIAELKGLINTTAEKLQGAIETSKAQNELKAYRIFIGSWIILAGLITPLLNQIIDHFMSNRPAS